MVCNTTSFVFYCCRWCWCALHAVYIHVMTCLLCLTKHSGVPYASDHSSICMPGKIGVCQALDGARYLSVSWLYLEV